MLVTAKVGEQSTTADEPEADEPEADEPEAAEPEADEPEADEPEADEPGAAEPEPETSRWMRPVQGRVLRYRGEDGGLVG